MYKRLIYVCFIFASRQTQSFWESFQTQNFLFFIIFFFYFHIIAVTKTRSCLKHSDSKCHNFINNFDRRFFFHALVTSVEIKLKLHRAIFKLKINILKIYIDFISKHIIVKKRKKCVWVGNKPGAAKTRGERVTNCECFPQWMWVRI